MRTATTRQAYTNPASSVIDGLGRETDYTYYDSGRVHTIKRAAGTSDEATTTFEYEPLYNQLSKIIDPLQHAWTNTYDGAGRMTGTTDPLGHHTTIGLNAAGQVTSVTDPLTHQWQLGYTDGISTATTNPLNQTATRFVDGAGRLIATIDSLERRTQLAVDKLNRITAVTDASGGQTSFAFDANSNLL